MPELSHKTMKVILQKIYDIKVTTASRKHACTMERTKIIKAA